MHRVLIADDNVEQITILRKLLETLGYRVSAAFSTAECLAEIAQRAPDLVVMDLRFPEVADGLRLIRDVRATFDGPLVVLSGWPDDLYGTPEEAMVTRIIVKGIARELLQAISEVLPAKPAAASAPCQNRP